jgi:competence protein ComEC
MTIQQKNTRFRAYQLENKGSSLSYFDGDNFTLIEARYTDTNKDSIDEELSICRVNNISVLHITSWDQDHCSPSQLELILQKFNIKKIEYPGYSPHTDCGKESLKIILTHKKKNEHKKIIQVTPEYISSLNKAEEYGYNNILYHPKFINPTSANNNSTVKQFRKGSFNLLSLGDVECPNLSSGLSSYKSINSEVDVMILAHHGANNGFTTSSFLKKVKPHVAIATSDYNNQFEHPKQEIKNILYKNEINLFTTKTGDVVIYSIKNHTGHFRAVNLKAGSTAVSSEYEYYAKKSKFLKNNADSIRQRQNGKPFYRKF